MLSAVDLVDLLLTPLNDGSKWPGTFGPSYTRLGDHDGHVTLNGNVDTEGNHVSDANPKYERAVTPLLPVNRPKFPIGSLRAQKTRNGKGAA
jgi:hypothetical protein